jgi:hypothetical protein
VDFFSPQFIDVPVAPGVSFKQLILSHPHIPGMVKSLAKWALQGADLTSPIIPESKKIYFSTVYDQETFLADYVINTPQGAVEVGVRIKKINLND